MTVGGGVTPFLIASTICPWTATSGAGLLKCLMAGAGGEIARAPNMSSDLNLEFQFYYLFSITYTLVRQFLS